MLTMTNQKFKIWNKENSIQNDADKLQIIITKAGITFLAKTAEKLKLKEGAEVTFLQSEEDESRWFLTAAVPGGMVLKKRADGNLQIKAGLLSAAMIKCVGSARMGGGKSESSSRSRGFAQARGAACCGSANLS